MNNPQCPPFEVYFCPIGHRHLCRRRWKNRFINHLIICNCDCHKGKEDLR